MRHSPTSPFVPGSLDSYDACHPSRAHLIVEVAQSALAQDRLTESAIYARAGVPCYWIVNLRESCVEVNRDPDRWRSEYRRVSRAIDAATLVIDAFPDVALAAAGFLPATRLDHPTTSDREIGVRPRYCDRAALPRPWEHDHASAV